MMLLKHDDCASTAGPVGRENRNGYGQCNALEVVGFLEFRRAMQIIYNIWYIIFCILYVTYYILYLIHNT